MVVINLTALVQIVSIVVSIFGIIIGVQKIQVYRYFSSLVISLFFTFCCVLLLFVEIFIIPCFRFFGFLLKPWGKAFTYLFLSFLITGNDTFSNITQVVFWILSVIYFLLSFLTNGISRPILQQTGEIYLTTAPNDYFV